MKANCDWKGCGSAAANHVRYGFSEDPERAPEVAFHGDYCGRHTEYIEETITNKHKFPLGQCPDGCDFGGMKVIQTRSPPFFALKTCGMSSIPNTHSLIYVPTRRTH